MAQKLSVFIITFNEALIIDKCLEKLSWVDEIVVVDSGSTDATLEICNNYGAKIFHKDFNGFGAQKQFALEQTTNDWVLSLDADEILTNELITEIQSKINQTNTASGYYIKRKHVFLDKVFDYGHESRQYILRLFKKEFGSFDGKTVHESVVISGDTDELKNSFLHYSYTSLDHYVSKLNNYTRLYAKRKSLNNKRYSLLEIFIKAKFEFFKKYILERNFLNGLSGLHWSVLSAVYTYLKCLKTNELKNRD